MNTPDDSGYKPQVVLKEVAQATSVELHKLRRSGKLKQSLTSSKVDTDLQTTALRAIDDLEIASNIIVKTLRTRPLTHEVIDDTRGWLYLAIPPLVHYFTNTQLKRNDLPDALRNAVVEYNVDGHSLENIEKILKEASACEIETNKKVLGPIYVHLTRAVSLVKLLDDVKKHTVATKATDEHDECSAPTKRPRREPDGFKGR